MKVAVIGIVGVPANYGGYETLVDNLIQNRINSSVEYVIYCSSKAYSKDKRIKTYKGHKIIYLPLKANGYQAVLYDNISLIHAWFTCSCLLSLGTASSLVYSFLRLIRKRYFIVNLDGLDHKREKWASYQKRIMSFTRKLAIRLADEIISDNEVIKNNVDKEYVKDSNLIEYGGDNALKVDNLDKLSSSYNLKEKDYFFSVARIEPENNTHLILKAFEEMPHKIVFVGNWNNSQYGINLLKKYQKKPNYFLFQPIYESEELNLLRSNCKAYLHGHSKGGTNPSLVEAMSLGLPVFAYDVDYNIKTTENKCIYFKDVLALKEELKNITNYKLEEIGHNLEKVAQRRYTWKVITNKYEQLFLKYENKKEG